LMMPWLHSIAWSGWILGFCCGILQILRVLCQKQTVFHCCLFVRSNWFVWSCPQWLYSKYID
jgi:hypothetical protein